MGDDSNYVFRVLSYDDTDNKYIYSTALLLNEEWPPQQQQSGDDDGLKSMLTFLREPDGHSIIAVYNGDDKQHTHVVVAHARVTQVQVRNWPPWRQVVLLKSVLVKPSFRGRGLGKRIVRQAERHARIVYCGDNELHASLDNRHVYVASEKTHQAFYERLGYTQIVDDSGISIKGLENYGRPLIYFKRNIWQQDDSSP